MKKNLPQDDRRKGKEALDNFYNLVGDIRYAHMKLRIEFLDLFY